MKHKRQLRIADRVIDDESDCFVVAEIGHNHQGNLETCMRLIEEAKYCGADAVKLQKRHNRSLYTREFFDSPYNSEHAFGPTYGLHRQALEFGRKHFRRLAKYAKKLGIIFFATPFDFKSADFLADIEVPCFKIASADLKNVPLIKHVAKFKKPIIISTGGATLADLERAYEAVLPLNRQVAFLQCTATYPTEPGMMDLRVIETYRRRFPDVVIGLSDHYNGIALDVAALLLGARIIEKHFTLNRAMKGSDHAFSLEPIGLRKMIRDLRRTAVALGDGVKKCYQEELVTLHKMSKKIVAGKNLPSGHVISAEDLVFKSPGDGLAPYNIDKFLGKKLKIPLKKDQAFKFVHV